MTRTIIARSAIGSLVAVALACGYDSTAPGTYGTPPGGPGDPPADTTPAAIASLDGLWTSSGSAPALLRIAPVELTGNRNVVPSTTVTTSGASLATLNS